VFGLIMQKLLGGNSPRIQNAVLAFQLALKVPQMLHNFQESHYEWDDIGCSENNNFLLSYNYQ
jgi:hypothetical protein